MKDSGFKTITTALGFHEITEGIAHVALPYPSIKTIKKQSYVQVSPMIISSDRNKFYLTEEDKQTRGIYPNGFPMFSSTNSRWLGEDVDNYLGGETDEVDVYKELYLPIKSIYEENIDFYKPEYGVILTIWTIGTYFFSLFDSYPYILLTGTKGSGKTKVEDLASYLAFNAQKTNNATPASVFRLCEANRCTLLIDEGEMLRSSNYGSDLLLILNSGYKSGGTITRVNNETGKVEQFDVYSPKMIAAIQEIDSTLFSRCLSITMVKTADAEIGNSRINKRTADWFKIRDRLYRYMLTKFQEIEERYHEEYTNEISCRNYELWSPLLAIARHIDTYNDGNSIYEKLLNYAKQDKDQDSMLDSWHTALLEGLRELVGISNQYLVRDIRNAMVSKLESDEGEYVKSRWVGSALKRFGFQRGPRKNEGNTYYLDEKKVKDLLVRYQIQMFTEPPQESEHSELSEHIVEEDNHQEKLNPEEIPL